MSEPHGNSEPQKPIAETAKYLKKLISAAIPEYYALKPAIINIAEEESIRKGVTAFRNFLNRLYDRLISDGHLYAVPQKNPKNATDYPFFNYITYLLIDMGYHGALTQNGDSLVITEMPPVTASMCDSGKEFKHKIPASKQIECLRFLTSCGFVFGGVDLNAKAFDIMNVDVLKVSYPGDVFLLTGLKAMATANAEPRGDRWRNGWRNHDVFMRCDYRILKAEDTTMLDILKDFLHPLPGEIQKLALGLHQRYTDMGMNCLPFISLFDLHFCYWHVKSSKRVPSPQNIYQARIWEIALNPTYDFYLCIRSKNTHKYEDVIEGFPSPLRETIIKGYGCDRKRGEPCKYSCQGIRIPLDDSVLKIGRYIETWLDNEMMYLTGSSPK